MIAASDKNIVTLGIEPTHPETGYGYIHFDNLYHSIDNDDIYEVEEFTEKPELKTAKRFLKEGTYLWNSGMFVWQVETILENIKKHMPDLYQSLEKIKSVLGSDLEEKVIKEEFKELDSVSIDYGIMEKADDIYVITGDFGWDDLGSWPALERIKKVDDDGNVVVGKHYGIDTKNSIIHSPNKVVTTIGMKDVVIVDTEDAILICDKKRAQEVKENKEYSKKME
ncbi:MAG: sugar phosphate nucleotidyltransferase [Halanaerobiales bacterium]|nr:sugar phosphate nucleotidyltransferase [Halanaerobiales bacterium]